MCVRVYIYIYIYVYICYYRMDAPKPSVNNIRMLWAVSNKSWKKLPPRPPRKKFSRGKATYLPSNKTRKGWFGFFV